VTARTVAAWIAALAVALGVAGLGVQERSRPRSTALGRDIGVVSAPSQPASSPIATAGATAGATAEPTGSGGLLATHSTELGAQRADGNRPTTVAIPRLHLRAATTPAGVGSDSRSLDLPESARAVVWWAYGAWPGATSGTVLLAGHVSWNGRVGSLAGLPSLLVGDRVALTRADGTVVRYAVTGRRHVPKASLAELGVFATVGAPRLVLVTCGGRYDAARRSYDDNVVVQARPV
jgi:Sortase domain